MSDQQLRDDIREAVHDAKAVLITSAVKPDGDSVAAQLALKQIIETYRGGKVRVDIVNEVACPHRYAFLPGADEMLTLEDEILRDYDVAFALDCSPDRIGRVRPLYDRSGTRITIDHHKVRTEGGSQLTLVRPLAGSTAEIIYDFIEDPAWNTPLTGELATILYTGMIFDSGGFLYKLTTPHTLRLAARLLETGFNFSSVAERVLLVRTYSARVLLGKVLSSMKRNRSGTVGYAIVTSAMMRDTDAKVDDLEGIVEQMIFTEGVEVSVLAVELAENDYKLSLRSRGKIDVATLANDLDAQGGGHDRAAGCNMKGDAREIIWRVVAEVDGRLEALTAEASDHQRDAGGNDRGQAATDADGDAGGRHPLRAGKG